MSAWTVIGHTEVGSGGVSSILFSNIPQTFDDLVLVASLRLVDGGDIGGRLKLNGTVNTQRILFGTGSSVTSDTNNLTSTANASIWTANTFSNVQIHIPNYKSSVNKSFSFDAVTENNGTAAYQAIAAGLVATNTAVTSLEFYSTAGAPTLAQYGSATLYGITKGSSGGVTVS